MNAAEHKIHIVGISDDGVEGLSSVAKQLLQQAEVVVGSPRSLSRAGETNGERIEWTGGLDAILSHIEDNAGKRTVLVASGDPLFYGTARFLCDKLGKERFEVLPHVSSMQLAFARVKESWDDAYFADLSQHSIAHVVEKVRTAEKSGLFTTADATPQAVAAAMIERGIDYFTAYVCENLGSPDECVTRATLPEIAEQTFAALNVMILLRNPDSPDRPVEMQGRRLFGNRDDAFEQSQPKRGLLTPSEVRCAALAQMDIGAASTVWDIGAGSGSVAIEAAQIASKGRVYAIEMDVEDYRLIGANAERFGVTNLTPILGEAPAAWNDLPAPDAIFVGGEGREVAEIAGKAFDALKPGGRLAATTGSIENLASVRRTLAEKTPEINVWMMNFAQGVFQFDRLKFEAMNPAFLIAAVKPAE